GGGDVTLSAQPRPTYPATASLDDLALRTATALGSTRSVPLCLDTTAWSGPARAPGWNASYFTAGDIAALSPLEVDEGRVHVGHRVRVDNPANAAGAAFGAALRRH